MAAALHIRILSGAHEEGCVTLPAVAVFSDADGRSCVWKISDNMKTQRIRVETGSLKGDEIVILSGVSPGDRIVSAGARFLVEGQAVRLMDNGKGSAS
jgi:multidrug efflux pump subunit AcrA (membrane-fusion protein)